MPAPVRTKDWLEDDRTRMAHSPAPTIRLLSDTNGYNSKPKPETRKVLKVDQAVLLQAPLRRTAAVGDTRTKGRRRLLRQCAVPVGAVGADLQTVMVLRGNEEDPA